MWCSGVYLGQATPLTKAANGIIFNTRVFALGKAANGVFTVWLFT